MNHFTFSAALASIGAVLAAGYTWFLNPSRRVNQLFALYWFSIAFWAFFVGTQAHAIPVLSGFWWGWLLHLGCTFIPVLLFHSVIVFINSKDPRLRTALGASYVITILFNLLNLWPGLFTGQTIYRDAYAYPKPVLFFPLYFVLFVALVVWSTLLLIRQLPLLSSRGKNLLKIILVTHVLAYLGGLDNFLIMVDVRLPGLYPYGLYVIPFYALVTSYGARSLFRDMP